MRGKVSGTENPNGSTYRTSVIEQCCGMELMACDRGRRITFFPDESALCRKDKIDFSQLETYDRTKMVSRV